MGSTFGRLFAAAAAVGIGAKVFDFLRDSIDEAREAQKVGAQTEAVIKSTGAAAGLTAQQFADLATSISNKVGIDDELIQSSENVLATFTNVRDEVGKGNDIFTQATQVITDLSVAMGQDMQSSAVQVGKALNDPIKGMTALQRVGVTFTEQQRDQVAALVESGRTMEAQKVILAELTREFGGSAAAQATAADRAAVAWGNFKEAVGTALLPVLDRLATFFTTTIIPALNAALPRIEGFIGRVVSAVTPALQKLGEVFGPIFAAIGPAIQTVWNAIQPVIQQIGSFLQPALDKLGQWLQDNPAFVQAFAVALVALVAAITLVTAATTAFSIALNSTGIPLVIIAIAALVAGLVLAYQKSETFRSIVDSIGASLRSFAEWIRSDVVPVVTQLAQKVGQNLKPVLEQLGQTFQQDILPTIQKIIAKFREWQPTIQRVAAVVVVLVAKWLDFATTIAGKVLPPVIRFIGFVVGNVVPAILNWISITVKVIGKLLDFAEAVAKGTQAVVKFASTVVQKVSEVVAVFTSLPGKILGALAGLAGRLFAAGVALMSSLAAGIRAGIQHAIDEVQNGLSKIAGMLPGSPIKWGPLKSWNGGGAGLKLMGFLGDGFRAGTPDATAAMQDAGEAVGYAFSDTFKSFIEQAIEQLKSARDRIRDELSGMKDDFASLKDSIAQAFSVDLFGATSAQDFAVQSNGALGTLFSVTEAWKKLSHLKGLSQDFLNALFASGNTALILDFASGPKSDVLQASQDWLATQSLSNQLGTNVANDTFGKGIKRLENKLDQVNDSIKHIGGDLADALNGAASNGHRRRTA